MIRKPKINALIACVCMMCVLCTGIFAQAQNTPVATENLATVRAQAITDATRDAHNTISSTGWYFIGCLGGIAGVIAAYVFDSNASQARLIGRSSDYAIIYSDTYTQEAKKIKTHKAWSGCITLGVFYVAYVAIVCIVAANSGSNNSY